MRLRHLAVGILLTVVLNGLVTAALLWYVSLHAKAAVDESLRDVKREVIEDLLRCHEAADAGPVIFL